MTPPQERELKARYRALLAANMRLVLADTANGYATNAVEHSLAIGDRRDALSEITALLHKWELIDAKNERWTTNPS